MKQYSKELTIWEHLSWICTVTLVFMFGILTINVLGAIVCGVDNVGQTPSLGYSGLFIFGVMLVSNYIGSLVGGKQ